MPGLRIFSLTLLAVVAFAGNSILCRLALKHTAIDPASFTSVRILSGACVLWLIVRLLQRKGSAPGSWWSAFALFAYAAAFSFSYVSLPAATGALLLFGAVQATMIGYGFWRGERLAWVQILGLGLAAGGLVFLLLPGVSAPPLVGSVLMLCAGVAWGIYSLRGKGSVNATSMTAGNFARASCFAVIVSIVSIVTFHHASWDRTGILYAVISGAITSGMGYAIWYTALRELTVTSAATVQLSVPLLAALGGVVFLGEPVTQRLSIASVTILSSVLLVILTRQRRAANIATPSSNVR